MSEDASYTRRLRALKISPHEAVAVLSVQEFLELSIPARAFLPKANNPPLVKKVVNDVRELHELIQRDLVGQKLKNASGDLKRYIEEEWLPSGDGEKAPSGVLGPFTLMTPNNLDWADDEHIVIVPGQMFIIEDGESRGEAILQLLDEMDPEEDPGPILEKRISVVLHYGLQIDTAGKWFADINGKGVRVNPNLTVGRDYTDPYRNMAKEIFPGLGAPLELESRQVRSAAPEVFTVLQARLGISAMVLGPAAVGFGAGRIPPDGVDFEALEKAAQQWFAFVFKTLTIPAFKDKSKVLRSVPVLAAIGAVGRAYFDGDDAARAKAKRTLADDSIDWTVGPHWSGICGKVNPNTGRFSVGSAKEYGNAAHTALTDRKSRTYRQIRRQEKLKAA